MGPNESGSTLPSNHCSSHSMRRIPPNMSSCYKRHLFRLLRASEPGIRYPQRECRRISVCTSQRGYELPSRSEEHTSELQSLMRISSAVFCLNKKTKRLDRKTTH